MKIGLNDYHSIKIQLDKVSLPYLEETKDLQKRISVCSDLLATLNDHRLKETLPGSIIPMVKPQVPSCIEERFSEKFQEINKRACREVLDSLIFFHRKERAHIKEDITRIMNNLLTASMDYLDEISLKTKFAPSSKTLIMDLYSNDLSETLKIQKKKIFSSGSITPEKLDIKEEEIEVDVVDKSKQPVKEHEEESIQALSSDVKEMQRDVYSLKARKSISKSRGDRKEGNRRKHYPSTSLIE